jgi:hypothetical protein
MTFDTTQNRPKKTAMAQETKKVLIVLSDASSFPLYNTGSDGKTVSQDSGYFLMELAKPLQKMLDAGCEVTFAVRRLQVTIIYLTYH